MDKPVIYPCCGILLSNEKEKNIAIRNNLDEFPMNYAQLKFAHSQAL
jgi:hypothetical protein